MAKKSSISWERKIVITTTSESEAILLGMIQAGECRLVKELKLLEGYLCEFPMQGRGLALLEGHSLSANIVDDPRISLVQPHLRSAKAESKPRENWGIKKIQANEVWKISKGAGVKVAVLDTGINLSHPALRANIKGGINILKPKSSPNDDNGHGTHVAGIIGACENKSGLCGVAPEVALYAVKIFDSRGEANLSDIVEGLQWCLEQDIKLINLSFGISNDNHLLQKMIQKAASAGLIMVCAAGNEGSLAGDQQTDNVLYPARYPETIAVSALSEQEDFATYSSSGPQIDFIAPGSAIYSTGLTGKYTSKSGTSFAAPHLTGVLALLMGYWNTAYARVPLEPSALRKILSETAQLSPKLSREQQGAGLINALKAFSYISRHY